MELDTKLADNSMMQALDKVVHEAVNGPTEAEKKHSAMLECIYSMLVTAHDEIPADVNTMCISGVDTFAREGLHFVKAKAKMGKSSTLAIFESVYVGPKGEWAMLKRLTAKPLKVCHVDTEQKPYDTQQFIRKVLTLADTTEEVTGENLKVINMRKIIDNEEKKSLIRLFVEVEKPDVLVIDGIVDLLDDFNDVAESKKLIEWLMQLADEFKLVLFCVLHTNKNLADHNMRGHIGTMSEQKCDTTIECEKNDGSGIVKVKCANSRHRPFPEWSFTWDDFGNLIDAQAQQSALMAAHAEEMKQERERKARELLEQRKSIMLDIVRKHGGSIMRSELTAELEKAFDVSRKTVSPLISDWIKGGDIFENDKQITLTPQTELFKEQ